MLRADILDAIGGTPLVRLHLDDSHRACLYAKLELLNPFGMKDRVAKRSILEARRSGALAPSAPIIESSSGTMALGVALVGRALGHDVHIVTDPRIDPVTRAKLAALGCHLHVVERMTDTGWQGARLELLHKLLARFPEAFWPRQYDNPDNPRAYCDLAQELVRDLGRIDILVGAVGSGGSLCGTARALLASSPGLRTVAVDAVGSVIFGQPDRPGRLQGGLGNSLVPANVDLTVIDEVHWLNDSEAFSATLDLAREQQIFAGSSSGSVYAVACHLARTAAAGAHIVAIFPDRGDRYFSTVYDQDFRASRGLSVASPEEPRPVRPETAVESWSYAVLKG